ncbi:PhaM family polyhydroxyalkanoate granule multifunctional regulatory protein [uncultured Rhodoferax sp.]|uniref:PhaM family polyhydroxyalkanoate granule multifunctional regulatory protein n=1 Tax=uncultured Rhodoferax sp. TaxID=223188 RepID=UPI0025DAD1D9|nr:PhaM family polyhydroxyalkanoate granule multifunctional regulatory protein [uncultured Rhodoferax sp.]
MSDNDTSGFGKFVPGFDFLQTLAKGAGSNIPQMPNLANWVAPTLNVEELEKRIEELKNVHFWLEQNSRALGATIQALEVQKMTLATLKGMNFNLGDVANALKLKAADSVASSVQRVTEKAATTAKTLSDVASSASKGDAKGAAKAVGVPGLVDPLQLWGSLTQQFQSIAATAMKEATAKTAVDLTKNMATGLAKEAIKSATAAGKKAAAKRPAARKTAARKTSGR